MKSPIKNYFQKIYMETGKKPFTFLNCFLSLIVPIAMFIIVGSQVSVSEGGKVAITVFLSVLIAWGLDIFLLVKNFHGQAVPIFLLGLLASIAFLFTFILWPVLKFAFRAGMAATQANNGNITDSVNSSRKAGATKGKKSALNWFEYDGYEWKDEKEVMPEDIPNYELDEGSYTYDQNQQARNMGYTNAKDAEMHGQKIN